mmetsp:Transcript_35634/g.52277  ORF Transcript_35634/g.52277 Transcript_35634/m.52277 type:complete len:292 (-) Transcript_35634:156-1031(-)
MTTMLQLPLVLFVALPILNPIMGFLMTQSQSQSQSAGSLYMAAYGYCNRCQKVHTIPTTEEAKSRAIQLRDTLLSTGRLDFDNHRNHSDPLLNVDLLFTTRGKMFGVLLTTDGTGNEIILKAFAGKIRSYGWNLDGWVPSLVVPEDVPRFVELRDDVSRITDEMNAANVTDQQQFATLKDIRTKMSREALGVMRSEQMVGNFRGDTSTLSDVFLLGPNKMPVGTGECCATKLIAAACAMNLKPVAIAEFFLGKGKDRRVNDGIFYDSCEARCQKVLGFMLCGLDDDHEQLN